MRENRLHPRPRGGRPPSRWHVAPLALALLLLGGCGVEDDGYPLEQESHQGLCPEAASNRPSVKREWLDAFPGCCDGQGHLIPPRFIPEDFQDQLAVDTSGAFCVPDVFAVDADYTPPACVAIGGLPGACLPECLPEIASSDVRLSRSTCGAGERCAPCRDPRDGVETGACAFGEMACQPIPAIDDCAVFEPTLELDQFEHCCADGRAHCAPRAYVAVGQRDDLFPCGADGLCVPDDLIARIGRFQPKSCTAVGGVEGRCLSVCIKTVAADLELLGQDICAADERCAPCYDPRTGEATGACTLGPCDAPQQPPETFQQCGASGPDAVCIPEALVPAAYRERFDDRGCGRCDKPGTLCVPKAIVDAGESFSPAICKNSTTALLALLSEFLGGNFWGMFDKMAQYEDGRCISTCMPEVRDDSSTALLGNAGCEPHELCIPCYDPLKIEQGLVPTGACDF